VSKIEISFFSGSVPESFSENPESRPLSGKILVPDLVPVRGQKTGKKGHQRSLQILK